MFYLLHGQDTYRSREKLNELVKFFRVKMSDLGVFNIDNDNFTEAEFEELIRAKNLFNKKYVVVCDRLFDNKHIVEFVAGKLERCAASENIFIFWEEILDEKILKSVKKNAAKMQEFNNLTGVKLRAWFNNKKIPPQAAEKIISQCVSDLWCAAKEIEKYQLGGEVGAGLARGEYNPFAICDAFAAKDKAGAWALLQVALLYGVPAEDVFYKILWQIKNLLLIKKLVIAKVENLEKETGLHPFVIKKALRAAENFNEGELINYSGEMVRIYHEERRGLCELPIELEKFILSF